MNRFRKAKLVFFLIALLFVICTSLLASDKPFPTQKLLNDMMSSANRIRIIDAGMEGGKAMKGEVLLDTENPKDITEFRSLLSIIEDHRAFGYCMCLGEPTIEFYKDKKLIATIALHHGRSIRWNEWKADVILKDNEKLLDWLANHHVKKPKQEYEEDVRLEKESEKRYEKWLSAMPAPIRVRWEKIDWSTTIEPSQKTLDDLWSVANASFPDRKDLVLSLITWYGSGAGPWSGFPSYESAPEELLLRIDTREIVKNVLDENLSVSQLEGTARYLCGWSFHKKKPEDKALIPEDLKQRILAHVKKQNDKDKITRAQKSLFQ